MPAAPARRELPDLAGPQHPDFADEETQFEDLRVAHDEMLRATSRRGWRPGQQYTGGTSSAAWAPTVDISERKDAYLVAVELPGVSP